MAQPAFDREKTLWTHPALGITGVLLGAMIATMQGRLLSVGLNDLRGALGLGLDEASWLSTFFNAALMFIGPFSVYLGGLLGARRVLLACGVIFSMLAVILPFANSLTVMLGLLAFAGLAAGTFYPLTLSFILRNLPMRYVLFGIAAYAMDIVFTTHLAHSLEAFYITHLSWRWIFWNSALLTPVMLACIYWGIPRQPLPQPKPGQPKPKWNGFLYFSLGCALVYAALDQGQRLDWWRSGLFLALFAGGIFMLLASVTQRLLEANPLVNLRFLWRRNILSLAVVLIFFRFVLLGTVVALPSFLGTIRGYRPEQIGPVLLWIVLPQILCGLLAVWLLGRIDARLVLTAGFTLVAIGCMMNARIDPAWAGSSFWQSQLILAIGQALAFNGLVGSIILEVINTGALERPIDVLTFAGFFQTVRLLGGEIGATFMQHWIATREEFHSNLLGLHVQAGAIDTAHRLAMLRAGLAPESSGIQEAGLRGGALLSLQVRQQAFTLAIADAFTLVAWAAICVMVVIACMGEVKTKYRDVIAAPAPVVAS
jgi:DHA2 family multidrug resistance protein